MILITSSTLGACPLSPKLCILEDQYPSVFQRGESQYSSIVGIPKTADKCVKPVSTPIVIWAPATKLKASAIEKAFGTIALEPTSEWCPDIFLAS